MLSSVFQACARYRLRYPVYVFHHIPKCGGSSIRLALEEWLKEAAFVKKHLTDEVIDEAFQLMPQKAQELSSARIKEVLRARRDNLPDLARRMYDVYAKKVGVMGTEKSDYFEVIRQDAEHTSVKVFPIGKKGKPKKKNFNKDLSKISEKVESSINNSSISVELNLNKSSLNQK